MPKPRRSGGRPSMRRSSSQMLPPVSGSRPAMQFSAVDFPHPEGPRRATNSPLATVRSRLSRALCSPKLRETPSSRRLENFWSDTSAPLLAAAHPAVPLVERGDLGAGGEGRLDRVLLDPVGVLVAAELLEHVLAVLRRHRQRHALD